MPYLHLDLPGTYPIAVKRELATRLCKLYADIMETQLWRPNVGIAELGEHNLYHLGSDGLEPITMVMVEFRRGRPAEKRFALGEQSSMSASICSECRVAPSWSSSHRMLVKKSSAMETGLQTGRRLRPSRADMHIASHSIVRSANRVVGRGP
jgi:hypothetical protein